MAGTNQQLWDAIIVGAGPAGAAAAYDLACARLRVLLVDKAEFPRPKACAGGLTHKALKALRYSVAPVTRKTVTSIDLEHPSAPGGCLTVSRSAPVCAMTVRSELDLFALDQARARGAEFRRVGALRELAEEEQAVRLSFEGDPEPLRARYVLGADGVHSRVRTLLCASQPADWFRRGFALEANVPYAATGGREFPLVFDFNPVPGGYGWLFPRNDHVNVGLGTFVGDEHAAALDRTVLTRYIAQRCGTAEHDRAVGQFLGMGAAAYQPQKWSHRVLLAGDAAGAVDALTGEGIYGAIVSGQAAAKAMLAALRGGGPAAPHYSNFLSAMQRDLRVSDEAAVKFYARPERGFSLMRNRWMQRAVLKGYADGGSLAVLAQWVSLARRFAGASPPAAAHV